MTGNGGRADTILWGFHDPAHRVCDNCGADVRGTDFYRTGDWQEFCLPSAEDLGVRHDRA